MTPTDRSPPASNDGPADVQLQGLLRALPPPEGMADLGDLNARVMAQWQQRHGAAVLQPVAGGSVAALAAPRGSRARWWVASTGLAAGVALALGLWLQQADPTIDELLQPDVLSQMAAGEM